MDIQEIYGTFETAWCPGCGNFKLIEAVKAALYELEIRPEMLCIVSGIGQGAKAPHYLKCHVFNGLHGRSLPVAQGVKLANPGLTVIAESGDGCHYGEGGNHFLAAIRRNVDITMVVHNNQIYGLTKGQASPTTARGHVTKAQPFGSLSTPFNPVAVAVAMGAGFVARGFVGEAALLTETLVSAITHPGFSLVDILQPCVSFNKINTHAWYRKRCYPLTDHDPTDLSAALTRALEFGDRIPLGILRQVSAPDFAARHPTVSPLFRTPRPPSPDCIEGLMKAWM